MKFISFFFLFCIGCGYGGGSPSLNAYNERCLKGKKTGEYLVKLEDDSYRKVFASSTESLYQKIQDSDYLRSLKIDNKIIAVDYNFQFQSPKAESLTNRENLDVFSIGPDFIGAQHFWNKGYYGQSVKIALIDSGFDVQNPVLMRSVLQNVYEQGDDEDQNGYKNDLFGWNFITNKPLTSDAGNHGTQVGSVIATKHTEQIKFSIAPGSWLIPIAALNPGDAAVTSTSGDSNSVIKALNYAVLRGADIINASWGGENCSTFIRDKIREVTDQGILFVTAAGNESRNLDKVSAFPASLPYPLVVTTGASNLQGQVLESSNYGSAVDFFALGHRVLALNSLNQDQIANDEFIQPVLVTGTSIATPFISGALALIKSAFPQASPQNLVDMLKNSSDENKIPNLERINLPQD